MKRTLFFLFIAFSLSFSGPWGKRKGEIFIVPQFYKYSAKKYWDKKGNKRDIGCKYDKSEYAMYGEYGFSAKTTLLFRIPYISVECGKDSASGVGDIEAGFLRKLIKKGSGIVSLQTILIIPAGYSINKPVRIGYGRPGAEIYLLSGYGFKKAFIEGGVGFRYYAGYPSEQLRTYGRLGFKPVKRFMVMNTLELHYGLETGEQKNVGRNVTLEPNYKLLQNDLFITFKVGRRLNLGAGWIESLWGRNVGVGRSIYTQIWFSF